MRRILASLMAIVMLMSSVPALADAPFTGGKLIAASGTGKSAAKVDYTTTIAKSPGFEAAYAVFTKSGHVYSDENLTKPAGEAARGDVVYALSRKGVGTSKARVRVSWVCNGKAQTGWVKATFLRLMSKQQRQDYVNEVKNNKKLVKVEGRYLLPIKAYKKAAAASATATPKPESSQKADLPTTTITGLTTQSTGLRVRWKAVDGAVKYQIWRSTKQNSGFKRLITVTDVTEWKDTSAKQKTAYFYQVRCVFADGSVSSSPVRGRWNDWGPALTVSTNASTGVTTLSWSAKANATNYMVYRAEAGSSSFKKVSTQTALTYVDKTVKANGAQYSYYVVANYKLSSGVTVPGTVGATKTVTYGVQPVSSVTVTNVAGGVQIKWPKVANASGYRVLYRVGDSGSWTKLTTTKNTVFTYKHTAPATGEKIQYAVRTEGKVNGTGVLAAIVQKDHYAVVNKPTLTLKAGEGVINASWTYVKGANEYVLFYKHADDAAYTRVVVSNRKYAIPALKAGKYSAYVRGRYLAEDGTAYAGPVGATVTFTAAGYDTSMIPVMTAELSDTPNMLSVSWNAIDEATGYYVDVKGAEGTSSYYFTAGQTSGLIAVNEGTYTVSMCANFSGEKGLYCDAQSIDADWADGLKLTAPVVSVSQSDTYNYADISWTAVDGAEEYFVTVEGNGETRTASIQATSVTLQLAGEGSYTILVRARKSVTGAINGYILGEAGVTATTFAWSDAAKYTPKMTLVLGDNANELIVAWDEVPDAEKYVVTVYGENDGWLQTANTTYLAATIHVNGGETVRACVYAVVGGENKPSCDWQTIDTLWDDMVAMEQPGLTYTLGEMGKVTVRWDSVADATGYELYVTAAGEGAGLYETTGTSWELTVTPEVAYLFNVVPVHERADGTVIYGARSEHVNCYPVWSEDTVPTMTFGLSTTPNVMLVSWDALATATEYIVELTGAQGTEITWRGTGGAMAFAVNGGDTYTARMRAVLSGGALGEWTESLSVTADWDGMITLTAPAAQLVRGDLGEALVVWEAVPGATKYLVSVNGGEATEVTGTTMSVPVEHGGTVSVTVEAAAATTAGDFTGPAVTVGGTLEWIPEMTLALSDTHNFLDISWTALGGVSEYTVSVVIGGEETTYTVAGTETSVLVNGGDSCTVKVAGVDEETGMEIAWCEEQTIQASWADMVTLTAPTAYASYDYTNKQVTVTYSAVTGATKYYVYAGSETDSDGLYASRSEATELSWTVAATPGSAYKYMVRAVYEVNGQSILGPESNVAWVTAVDIDAAPANLTADVSRTNYVTFAWDACLGASAYFLTYDDVIRKITDGTSVTYWTPDYDRDMTVTVYALYELDGNTYEGDTAELTFTPVWDEPAVDLPAPVASISRSEEANYLDISWEPAGDATEYLVLAYDVAGNVYEWETAGTSLHVWVSAGTTYTVRLIPVYENAEKVADSVHSVGRIQGPDVKASVNAVWDSAVSLGKPTVTAAASDTPNYVTFTWDAVDGATAYYVSHSMGDEIITGTSVTVAVPGNGTYGCNVYAFADTQDQHGPWSNWATVTTAWDETATITLAAPVVTVDTSKANVIELKWDEIEGADGYVITIGRDTYDNVSTTMNNTSAGVTLAVNGDGTTYMYTVRAKAEHPDTGEDVLSHACCVSATAQWDDGICMTKPAVTVTQGDYDGMTDTIAYTVSWTAQEGVTYRLAYTPEGGETVYTDATTDSTLTVDLPDGVKHTLKLQQYINAFGITKTWGPESDETTVTPFSGIDVTAVPQNVQIDVSEVNHAAFAWDACVGAIGYQYYLNGQTGVRYYTVADNANHFLPDTGMDATFWLRAVYYKGGTEYTSDWVKVDYSPVWNDEEAIDLPTPVVTASCTGETNYVEVSWEEIPDADSYHVVLAAWDEAGNACNYELTDATGTSAKLWVNAGLTYNVSVQAQYVHPETGEIYVSEYGYADVEAVWDLGVALGTPAVTIEQGAEPNTVKVSWTAADEADGYIVSFRGQEYNYSDLSVILPVPCSGDYAVSVCAWSGADTQHGAWGWSETISVYWEDAVEIIAPVATADMSEPNQIKFTWTAVEGASGYNVTLEKKVAGQFQTVTSGVYTTTSFTWTVNGDGADYRFSISAFQDVLVSDEDVRIVSAAWDGGKNLTARTVSVCANSYNEETGLVEVIVEWDEDPDADGYRLQYVPAGGTAETVTITDGSTGYGLELEKGVEYAISVTGFFCMGSSSTPCWGPESNVARITPAYGVDTLAKPVITAEIDADGCVLVSWDEDPNAFSYTVQYATDEGTEDAYVFAWDDNDQPVTSFRFLPESSETYLIQVCANWEEDGGVEAGPYSDALSFTAMIPAPEAVALTKSADPNYMEISWTPVAGATGYTIVVNDTVNSVRTWQVDGSVTEQTALVSSGEVNMVSVSAWIDYAAGHTLRSMQTSNSLLCSWTDGVTVAAPAGVKAELGENPGEVLVSWDAVPGINTYLVQPVSESHQGEACNMLVIGATSCKLTIPEEAWFEDMIVSVAGCLTDGTEHGEILSANAAAASLALTFYTAPIPTLTAGETAYEVVAAWEAVPGDPDYYISIADLSGELYPVEGAWQSVGKNTSYTFEAKPGQDYIVAIKAEYASAGVSVTDGDAAVNPYWEMPALNASVGQDGDNVVVLEWDDDPNAEGYVVYWQEAGAEEWNFQRNVQSPWHLGANGGTELDLYVESDWGTFADGTAKQGLRSAIFSETVEGLTLTKPVMTLSAETAWQIDVAWEPVAGATGYYVFYQIGETIDNLLGEADDTSGVIYVTEEMFGETVTVWMVAVYESGVIGFESPVSDALTIDARWDEMQAPEVSLTASGDNIVTVSWEEVPGASGYDLYVRLNGATGYLLMEDSRTPFLYLDPDGSYFSDEEETVAADAEGFAKVPGMTSPIHVLVNGGQTVDVRVAANFPWEGVDPALSPVHTAAAQGTTLGSMGLTATADEEGYIDLAWNAVEGADEYVVVQVIGDVREDVIYSADQTSARIIVPTDAWGTELVFWGFACKNRDLDTSLEGAVDTVTVNAEWTIDLPAPQLTVTTQPRGYITLTWNDIPDATRYRIFYKKSTDSGYSSMYVNGGETTVQIPAANNATYSVYMRGQHVSVNGTTTAGTACAAKTATTAWTYKLAAPTLTVTQGARGVLNASWTAVSGAAGYILRYKEASATAYTELVLDASETSAVLNITAEATYALNVTAFEGDASIPYEGKASAEQSIFATWAVTLTKPVMTLTQGSYKRLLVSWDPVDKATEYRIFYKESTASGYSSVTVDGAETSVELVVANGVTYQIYMRAINVAEDGVRTSGPICTQQTFTTAWDAPEVPVPSFSAEVTAGDAAASQVRYTWDTDDAYGYVLHMSVNGGEVAAVDVTDLGGVYDAEYVTGDTIVCYMTAYLDVDGEQFTSDPAESQTFTAAYGQYALTRPQMQLELGDDGEINVNFDRQTFGSCYKIYYKTRDAETYTVLDVEGAADSAVIPAEAETVYQVYMTAVYVETSADGATVTEHEGPACDVNELYTYWADYYTLPLEVKNGFNGVVTLTWEAVPGVTRYDVSYCPVGGGDSDWVIQDIDPDQTTLTLNLPVETAYTLSLSAYHEYESWGYGLADVTVSFTTLGAPALAAPTMTLALGEEQGYVDISWTAVENATRYSLFYRKVGDESYTNVKLDKSVTSYQITVEIGAQYQAYVRGIYDYDDGTIFSGTMCSVQTILASWTKYRALLIGQTYPTWDDPLPGPDVDARAMKSMLSAMSGTPYTSTLKLNLTDSGIISAISSAFAGATENDVSLFYYSGHGAYSEDTSYLGALCGTEGYVTVSQLKAALDQIPGKKIVLLDSCHSGAHIGKSINISSGLYTVSRTAMQNFNSSVISAFASRSKTNMATDNYYVITAARSVETSQSVSSDGVNWVGAFTYALCYGNGYDELGGSFLGGLYCDSNSDNLISLAECYSYAYTQAKNINSDQNAQVYPTGSNFTLWGK